MNMSICQECSVEDQETSPQQETKYKVTLPPPRKQFSSNHHLFNNRNFRILRHQGLLPYNDKA